MTHLFFAEWTKPDGITSDEEIPFYHEGDFSGDVQILVKPERIKLSPGNDLVTVSIPFEALAVLVAEAIRRKSISELEVQEWKEILGL